MDMGILPSLFELSREQNIWLEDRPSLEVQAALIAEGTLLQKVVRLFKGGAVDNAQDVQASADAARTQGFAGETKDSTSG
jgi:hypothetical protein